MDVDVLPNVVLGLPGVEEHEGWAGQPVFKVRNKSFAYLSEDGTRLLLKALREEQEAQPMERPHRFPPGHLRLCFSCPLQSGEPFWEERPEVFMAPSPVFPETP